MHGVLFVVLDKDSHYENVLARACTFKMDSVKVHQKVVVFDYVFTHTRQVLMCFCESTFLNSLLCVSLCKTFFYYSHLLNCNASATLVLKRNVVICIESHRTFLMIRIWDFDERYNEKLFFLKEKKGHNIKWIKVFPQDFMDI